jgi:cytochrome P450
MLPPSLPLSPALQTAFYAANPIGFLNLCARRYGDAFSINTLMFGVEVKQIFTGDPAVFRAGEANAPLEPLLGSKSVLLLDGPAHLRQRRLLMPPLHGDRMTAYGQTMIDVTLDVTSTWRKGGRLRVHPFMQRITLDVILRTVFGVGDRSGSSSGGARMRALGTALVRVLDRNTSPIGALAMLPALQHDFYGLSPYAAFKRDRARADVLILDEIALRRSELSRGGQARTDVLSMLLAARDEEGQAMTDGELRDELMTLLTAGHETTATGLSWAFDCLAHERRVQNRLRAELDDAGGASASGLGRLPYLDATIKEVLRLFPVVPAVGRRLGAPATVGGFDLPKGMLVVPAVYHANRHRSAYDEPEKFFPERFLENKPDPYAWIPFGGGTRRCLGMAFALYEMKAVLATLLARYEIAPAKKEPAKTTLRAFTHAPKGGGDVVIEPRRARAATERTAAAPAI